MTDSEILATAIAKKLSPFPLEAVRVIYQLVCSFVQTITKTTGDTAE